MSELNVFQHPPRDLLRRPRSPRSAPEKPKSYMVHIFYFRTERPSHGWALGPSLSRRLISSAWAWLRSRFAWYWKTKQSKKKQTKNDSPRHTTIQNDCLFDNARVQTETDPLICRSRNLPLKSIERRKFAHPVLNRWGISKRYSIIKIVYVKKN